MTGFLLRRILAGILTLFVISTICFAICRFAPGNPFSSEKQLSPEVRKNLEEYYGWDKPILVQYFRTIAGYLRGDLGPSYFYRDRSVNDLVWPAFQVSIILGILAFIVAISLGVPLGILASAKQNKLPDYATMSVAVGGLCIPNFLLGPLLVLLFAFIVPPIPAGWRLPVEVFGVVLPVVGIVVILCTKRDLTLLLVLVILSTCSILALMVPFDPTGWPQDWTNVKELKKLILPAITLSMVHVAYISRLTRAGMLDVMNKDYVRTARAKGLDERTVFLKHGLKNGITPAVSYIGPMAALLITGSIVVEKVFDIPGLGQHFVKGALNRDHMLTMGTVLVYSTLVIIFNLIVDLMYGLLDPRVRVQ